jgi:hypothetical protein
MVVAELSEMSVSVDRIDPDRGCRTSSIERGTFVAWNFGVAIETDQLR